MKNYAMFLWGLLFALGMGISGMMQPGKVIGFLDILGDWDPSLMMVMAAAVTVYFTLSRTVLRRNVPVFEQKFALPTRMDIDKRLVAGAALFGLGWGLGGFCPGPALATMVTGNSSVLVFVLSMSAGMFLYGAIDSRFSGQPDGGASLLDDVDAVTVRSAAPASTASATAVMAAAIVANTDA